MPEMRLAKCRALYQELNRELPPVIEGEPTPPIERFVELRLPDGTIRRIRLGRLVEPYFDRLMEPDDDHLWGV